jgi:single-strand binding family protein
MEAWRKNEHTESFDQLTKGTLLTVEGYFKPDEWIDQQGTKHNRIVFIANKFYPALEKEEPVAESTEQPTTKTKKK